MIWKLSVKLLLVGLLIQACGESRPVKEQDPRELPWEAVMEAARGKRVDMMMWTGDPLINAYMKDFVEPVLRDSFDIELAIASGQGNTIVQVLMTEIQAGNAASELDLVWINGETFYQLRQIDALWGPWTQDLPHAEYIDFDNPFIGLDFQQPVDGYECPWGNVQMAIIYDSEKVPDPPSNPEELAEFLAAHPGKFTIDTQFTGLTFLKSLLIHFAGGPEELHGSFDSEKYERYSARLWEYLRYIRPYLWKAGQTFPEGVAPMHQMFANGELWFTMSNNDAEVDNKIAQGLFPESARAYIWEAGTIQNTHYLGIPKLADDKAAAMVVADFLISPRAQLKKQDPRVWGDGTVLDTGSLPEAWREKFVDLPDRRFAPDRVKMQERALMELAPEYMIRLAEDFRNKVLFDR